MKFRDDEDEEDEHGADYDAPPLSLNELHTSLGVTTTWPVGSLSQEPGETKMLAAIPETPGTWQFVEDQRTILMADGAIVGESRAKIRQAIEDSLNQGFPEVSMLAPHYPGYYDKKEESALGLRVYPQIDLNSTPASRVAEILKIFPKLRFTGNFRLTGSMGHDHDFGAKRDELLSLGICKGDYENPTNKEHDVLNYDPVYAKELVKNHLRWQKNEARRQARAEAKAKLPPKKQPITLLECLRALQTYLQHNLPSDIFKQVLVGNDVTEKVRWVNWVFPAIACQPAERRVHHPGHVWAWMLHRSKIPKLCNDWLARRIGKLKEMEASNRDWVRRNYTGKGLEDQLLKQQQQLKEQIKEVQNQIAEFLGLLPKIVRDLNSTRKRHDAEVEATRAKEARAAKKLAKAKALAKANAPQPKEKAGAN